MEPSDRINHEDVDAPAWERDPVVRRALAAALEPTRDGGCTTQAALDQLRGVLDARTGGVAIPKGGRFFSSRRVARRENSAERGEGGIGGFGSQTLHRYAVAVFATALGLVSYWGLTTKQADTPPQIYTTRAGQRLTIGLTDGTRITLAPQTWLRVDAGFGTKRRDVELTGQAYFDVISTNAQPFTVHTGDVTSRVLGTTFMVRRYPDEHAVVVAVQSGKVSAGRHNPVTLTSNTLARISDSTVVLTTGADLREYMEWRDGRLVFAGARAAEVATVLGRWYGLTFQFANVQLQNRSISGEFNDHESREDVLRELRLLLGVRMTFDGNIVTISSKRVAPASPTRRTVREETNRIPTEVGR